MFSRRLLTFSILLAAIGAYLYLFEHKRELVWLLAFGVFEAITVYVFQHQLNWWWYNKYPPRVDPQIHKMYERFGKFYSQLDAEGKKKFATRAKLFVEEKEFIPQGINEISEDIKFMIAYYAVMLTFDKKDFLFDAYRRIVIYLHPFLSPHYPDHVHTYEVESEDGTLIFSLEQLTAGFFNPTRYYQVGLHAFAELYVDEYLKGYVIDSPDRVWTMLSELSGWSKEKIEDFTGLPETTLLPVMLHHWFVYKEKMALSHSELYNEITKWFSQNQ